MSREVISKFTAGERLDKVLSAVYTQYSRSSLEKLIESGFVLVNDDPKPSSYKVKLHDHISIDTSPFKVKNIKINIPILYEDDEVIVLNKPTGFLTHSKGAFNDEATVASFIKKRLNNLNEWQDSNRAGIVHRLDRGTSGVIICAKTKSSQIFLQKQFAKRNVKKTYIAIVSGGLANSEGIIEVPLERNPKKPSLFKAGANGKPASTHFKVKSQSNNKTVLVLQPTTGRTHQLRVHLSFLHHPIIGDVPYGGIVADRIMLHAWKLEITLPSKERRTFTAPPPKEFNL